MFKTGRVLSDKNTPFYQTSYIYSVLDRGKLMRVWVYGV
jgi:hypothetical protein